MPEFHSEAERWTMQFLLERGYSAASLIYGYPFVTGRGFYEADFLVADPITQVHLAAIEVKGRAYDESTQNYQLRRIAANFRSIGIPFYVFIFEAPGRFRILRSTENHDLEEMPPELFPRFEALAASRIASKKEDLSQKKEGARDTFRFICVALAFLCLGLVALDCWSDFFGVRVLNLERIGLIGAAVALIVVPYAQKFKGLGFEYERFTSGKRDDEKG